MPIDTNINYYIMLLSSIIIKIEKRMFKHYIIKILEI